MTAMTLVGDAMFWRQPLKRAAKVLCFIDLPVSATGNSRQGAQAEHFRKRETGCGDCPAFSERGSLSDAVTESPAALRQSSPLLDCRSDAPNHSR